MNSDDLDELLDEMLDKQDGEEQDGEPREDEERPDGTEEDEQSGPASDPDAAEDDGVNAKDDAEERIRKLEERLASLSKGETKEGKEPERDIDREWRAAIRKRAEALAAGDASAAYRADLKAEELRAMIEERRTNERIREALLKQHAELTQQRLDRAAAVLVRKYPQLDSTSRHADKSRIADVRDLRDVYIRRGIDPVDALRKAVRKVMAISGDRPQLDETNQPPPTGNRGSRESTPAKDVTRMTTDEWAKLPKHMRDKFLS